jgi:hypothetical protein
VRRIRTPLSSKHSAFASGFPRGISQILFTETGWHPGNCPCPPHPHYKQSVGPPPPCGPPLAPQLILAHIFRRTQRVIKRAALDFSPEGALYQSPGRRPIGAKITKLKRPDAHGLSPKPAKRARSCSPWQASRGNAATHQPIRREPRRGGVRALESVLDRPGGPTSPLRGPEFTHFLPTGKLPGCTPVTTPVAPAPSPSWIGTGASGGRTPLLS